MAIEVSTNFETGVKCLWLSRGAFVQQYMVDNECGEIEGYAEFEKEWNEALESRRHGTGVKRRLLIPVVNFVYTSDKWTQSEKQSGAPNFLSLNACKCSSIISLTFDPGYE